LNSPNQKNDDSENEEEFGIKALLLKSRANSVINQTVPDKISEFYADEINHKSALDN
jgi:hypothetical protein